MMLGETYEWVSNFFDFKTKEGVAVMVKECWTQSYRALEIIAKFTPKEYPKTALIYTKKISLEDFVEQRNLLAGDCITAEYERLVNEQIKSKKKKDPLEGFKDRYMLHNVKGDYYCAGMLTATQLALEKILNDSPLFMDFLRDLKK